MKRMNKAIKCTVWFFSLTAIFFGLFGTSPAKATVLFEDNFDGSQADTWVPTISSPSPDVLDYTTLNGNTVLRMISIMSDGEIRGIYNLNTFNFSEGQITVDFRTMPYEDVTINAVNKKNIDGLLSFLLYNPTEPAINFHIFGGDYGAERTALIAGPGGYSERSEIGIWNYDKDYRIVVTSVGDSTKVSFRDTKDNVLFEHTFAFNLGVLDDFYIVLTQFMGTPLAEYYSDVALNYLKVSEPTPLSILDFYADDNSIVGIGNGRSANVRLNALKNMLKMADDLIKIGDIEGACDQLEAAQKKCDGDSLPPDFVTGVAVPELYNMIVDLMVELGCE